MRNALKKAGAPKSTFDYFEKRLHLTEVLSPGEEVRFVYDTFAEYLAAQYLVEQHNGSVPEWREFLFHADGMIGSPGAIRGFLLAVRDCYFFRFGAGFVTAEIEKRLKLVTAP